MIYFRATVISFHKRLASVIAKQQKVWYQLSPQSSNSLFSVFVSLSILALVSWDFQHFTDTLLRLNPWFCFTSFGCHSSIKRKSSIFLRKRAGFAWLVYAFQTESFLCSFPE